MRPETSSQLSGHTANQFMRACGNAVSFVIASQLWCLTAVADKEDVFLETIGPISHERLAAEPYVKHFDQTACSWVCD